MQYFLADFVRRTQFSPSDLYDLCRTKYQPHLELEICTRLDLDQAQFHLINTHTLGVLFELICACEQSEIYGIPILTWGETSPEIRDQIGLPYQDVGIDILDPNELTYAGQCKFYRPTTTVKAEHINRTGSCVDRARVYTKNLDAFSIVEFLTPPNVRMSRSKIAYDFDQVYIDLPIIRKWIDKAFDTQIPEASTQVKLRQCQKDCLQLHRENPNRNWTFRLICGSGKTLIGSQIVKSVEGRSCILVPSLLLMDQWEKYLEGMSVTCCGTGRVPKRESQVVVCVYNSFVKIQDWGWNQLIVDEAHHIFNKRKTKTSTYSTAIWNTSQATPTVFMSATLDGEADYSYSLIQGIEEGILTDYQIHVPVFSGTQYQQPLISFLQERAEFSTVLAYCNTVRSAKEFCDLCNLSGISAEVLVGSDGKSKRQKILREFREGEYRVLVSVNVLGEGVDLPCANTCVFVEPRSSIYSIVQIVGRTLRKYPGKELAHVILPGVDTDNEEYMPMVEFLQKLGQEDPRIYQMFASKTMGHRVEFSRLPQEIVDKEDAEVVKLLYENIFDRTVSHLAHVSWDFKLDLLQQFYNETGELPRSTQVYQGQHLGAWLGRQRTRFQNGKLDPVKVEKLDQISPDWKISPSTPAVNKESLFPEEELFRRFYQEYGRLPELNEIYEGQRVGFYLRRWRRESHKMRDDQIQRLDQITRTWRPEEPEQITWKEGLDQLQAYFQQHGELPDLHRRTNLSRWLVATQELYRNGLLTPFQISSLDQVDSDWRPAEPVVLKWSLGLEILERYLFDYHTLPRNIYDTYGGIYIYKWLLAQRQRFRDENLSAEQLQQLDQLDRNWRPNLSVSFLEECDKPTLRDFCSMCSLPIFGTRKDLITSLEEFNFKVHDLNYLVPTFGKSRMNKNELQSTLISLGIDDIWGTNATLEERIRKAQNIVLPTVLNSWEEYYELLQQFVDEYDRDPNDYDPLYQNVNLAGWLNVQFYKLKDDQLEEEKIYRLKQVLEYVPLSWTENLKLVQKFYSQFGRFPRFNEEYQGRPIGEWIHKQKWEEFKRRLNMDRATLLDQISTDWRKSELLYGFNYPVLHTYARMIGFESNNIAEILDRLEEVQFVPPQDFRYIPPDNTDFENWYKVELVEKCKQLGIDHRGLKQELVDRLVEFHR